MDTSQISPWVYHVHPIKDLAIVATVTMLVVTKYLGWLNITKKIDIDGIKDHNYLRIVFAEIWMIASCSKVCLWR